MSALRRRVSDLEAAAPPGGCPNITFHVMWHVIAEDIETRELPPRPTCPVCGMEAENVIEIVYEKAWRRLNDTPISRTSINW